jgi:hypothetical protein
MVPLGHVSIDKLNELGLKYQPIEETINDVVSSLKECGWFGLREVNGLLAPCLDNLLLQI